MNLWKLSLMLAALTGCGDGRAPSGSLRINTTYVLGDEAVLLLPATVGHAIVAVDARSDQNIVCEGDEWRIQTSTGAKRIDGFTAELRLPQEPNWKLYFFVSARPVEEILASRGPVDGDYFGVSNVLELDDCGVGFNDSKCFAGSFTGGRVRITTPVTGCQYPPLRAR